MNVTVIYLAARQTMPVAARMFLLCGLLISGAPAALASCEHCMSRDHSSSGEFLLEHAGGEKRPALLLDTNVDGDINGMLATISVTQRFSNQYDSWVNGRYVFPLPDGAAVDSLEISIGERVIKGIVKEKAEARKSFAKAKREGKKAGLLEQHRPNLFSVSVANIGPGEVLITRLRYVDRVQYRDDTFSLRFPTTLTPRYIAGRPLSVAGNTQPGTDHQSDAAFNNSQTNRQEPTHTLHIDPQHGWASNTDRVPDAVDITPPQTRGSPAETSHHFRLRVTLDAGLALTQVYSPSHAITSQFGSANQAEIGLLRSSEPLNRDLVLRWQANVGAASQAAFFQQRIAIDGGAEYYNMLMVMPPRANSARSLPRDVTFIIDSSGSMAGGSMQQARQALQQALGYLTSNDRFNVIDFDSQYRALFESPQMVTGSNLALAGTMIAGLRAEGGTEMLGALRFALAQPTDEAWLRQLVFITDGSIGNERDLFSLIDRQLGSARLFTVGIGSAPNAWFMRKAAKFGRGNYTYIAATSEVQGKMAELFARIEQPMLKNIRVNWSGRVEQYPQVIPDLYAGEPVVVVARSKQAISAIEISGEMADQTWQQRLQVSRSTQETTEQADNLDTVWARQKIEALMDQLSLDASRLATLKPLITELGLKHQLLTKFTSFIAVEQRRSKPLSATARHNNVRNLMPAGSTMPAPQTATTVWQKLLIGGLCLIIGTCLLIRRWRPSRRHGHPYRSQTWSA